jgi:aryl-alcohol dehydrogenase-like predicted oxidoreductase
MNFGREADETDSHGIMSHALDQGINFFDTANVYGGQPGRTEEIIGRWFAQGGRREKVVLATKVYGQTGDWPNQGRLSALNIRQACDASLRRLQTDYIDLYQMHHVDRETPWEEIWQAMEQLVQAGKVIYVGSSNFAAWDIVQANERAKARNFMGLVSEQSLYNLQERMVELEVIPACRAYGVGIIPWSPLAGGMLGGVLGGHLTHRRERLKDRIEQHRAQLEKFEALCKELGEEPEAIALAWLLANPAVTGPIIGPRTMAQLEGNIHSLDVALTDETMRKLDEIFPGPGGEAPMAYAW